MANIILAVMFVLCAFRGEFIGIDTEQYLWIYSSGYGVERYKSEFLFYFIVKNVYEYFNSEVLCQVLLAFLSYAPLFYLFNKKSSNIAISILIMICATNRYFFESMNLVRQFAATSYLLCAWVMIAENKLYRSLLFCFLAVGFHSSSVIYIPIALLAKRFKFSYTFVVVSEIITLFFALVISNVSILSGAITALSNITFLNISSYSRFTSYELELTRTFVGLIILLIPHVVVVFAYYKEMRDSFYMRLFYCGTIFLNIIAILPISYRITYGLIAIELLIVPMLYRFPQKKYIANALLLLLLAYSLYDLITTAEIAKLVPYNTFL